MRQNLHSLMLHYGVDHNVSMDLYLKHPKMKKAASAGKFNWLILVCSDDICSVYLKRTGLDPEG